MKTTESLKPNYFQKQPSINEHVNNWFKLVLVTYEIINETN